MRKIRILYVLEEYPFGGPFTHVADLARWMNSNQFEITLCILGRNHQSSTAIDISCDVVYCRMDGIWDFISIIRLKKIIQELKIDIVHTCLPRADVIGRIAARLAGISVIFTTIAAFDKHRERWTRVLHAFADHITSRFATKIICVSEAVKRHFCQWHPELTDRVITIYNCIEPQRFNRKMDLGDAKKAFGLSVDVPVIGLTARLCPVKGIEYLLDAVQRLTIRKIPLKCMIVGDGVSRMKLEAMANKLGIQDQVIFTGRYEDVGKALAAMDVFVLPSLSEGLSNSLLEAMVMCKPVVASEVGGIPEVVTDGETGILVPPKDSEKLAWAIEKLLSSPEKRKGMADKGYEKVLQRFDYRKGIKAYESLCIESIVGEIL